MNMPSGRLAGTRAVSIPSHSSEPSQTHVLSVRADYLRTELDLLRVDMHESHNEIRNRELNERTFEKSKKSLTALLSELAHDRGMSWSSIADLAQVSVSAVRKWRTGGAATPEKRRTLARFAAMLDMLEEKGIVGDPAGWMEMDIPFDEDGYFIRPLDLYLEGHSAELLDIAERRKEVTQVLDEVAPGWRARRSDYDIYVDTDGRRSIRLRGN